MRLPQQQPPILSASRRPPPGGGAGAPAGIRLAAANMGQAASSQAAPFQRGDLIYALGVLDYDFGSEAHRDFLVQYLSAGPDPVSPFMRDDLLAYLAQQPSEAEWLTWIVSVDNVPICAIEPSPVFGRRVYGWLQEVFSHPGHGQPQPGAQGERDVELLVSLPGTISGRRRLASGQVVPAVDPEVGGLFAWEQGAIARQLQAGGQVDEATHQKILQHVETFQRDAARELRNVGRSPRERALNFAVTAAFQTTEELALDYLAGKGKPVNPQEPTPPDSERPELAYLHRVWDKDGDLQLSRLDVRRSPICRPDAGDDCWDVRLVLFDPAAGVTQAGVAYQYTVDVSRAQPVVIGEMAQWATALVGMRTPA